MACLYTNSFLQKGSTIAGMKFISIKVDLSIENANIILIVRRILQKVLSLGSDYVCATFYQTYF